MNTVAKRETVESLFKKKLQLMRDLEELAEIDMRISSGFKKYNGWAPYRLEYRYENHEKNAAEKYIDRGMWRYLIQLYHLERYMLCTEYDKMTEQVEQFKTPDFTTENAHGWLDGLKEMIYENVRLMCKRVYDELITGHYHTGSGYSSRKTKKRNNNGVDARFILSTHDYHRIFGYWMTRPTITDDLEKVCYILDGEPLPDHTIIIKAKQESATEITCPYFSVKFCQNGNTHYKLTEETRQRLNTIGPDGKTIGQDIRIKILDE